MTTDFSPLYQWRDRMNRRSFISTPAYIAMLTTLHKRSSMAATSAIPQVGTTGQRYRYLRETLSKLCSLGPRPVGSPAFDTGIRVIGGEMEKSLPSVSLDEFSFEKWELIGDPVLMVGGRRLETYPYHGSAGTPAQGVSGTVKTSETGYPYTLSDPATGDVLAYIGVNPYGDAIPHNAFKNGKTSPLPIFGIGKYDRPCVDAAVASGETVFAHSQVRYTADVPSWSAVGTLPGRSQREIVMFAHADTVYPSPGANDNTASVIVMLMLAHVLSVKRHDYTITFVATSGEEYGYLGAKHYAETRRDAGTMKNIAYIMQFDSLTYGPDFLLTSEDEELKALVTKVNSDLGINGTPRPVDGDPFVMDASPFRETGARAIYINSRGYDGVTLPVYHRPDDVPATVAFDCVENSFRVLAETVERLQKL